MLIVTANDTAQWALLFKITKLEAVVPTSWAWQAHTPPKRGVNYGDKAF